MIFFNVALSWHWELGLLVEKGSFPEMISTIVVKNFSFLFVFLVFLFCFFFRSFLRTPFSSGVMLLLVMIPLLVKKGLIAFQMDLLSFLDVTFQTAFRILLPGDELGYFSEIHFFILL